MTFSEIITSGEEGRESFSTCGGGGNSGAAYGMLHKKMTVARGEMNDLRPRSPFFMTPINEKTATFIPAD